MPLLNYGSDGVARGKTVRILAVAVLSATAFFPGGLLLGAYASFTAVAIYVGDLPTVGDPNPATLPDWVRVPSLLMFPGFVLIPLAIALVAWRIGRGRPALQVVMPAVMTATLWLGCLVDPIGALAFFAQ